MDILYRLERASAKEIMQNLADPPTYSTVRTILQKLLEKGHISYQEIGPKYVYYPLVDVQKASKTALENVVRTFFQDSPAMAVNSLIDMAASELSEEELSKLENLIRQKKRCKKK